MQITVSARHLEISSESRKDYEKQILTLLNKFAERPTNASITFFVERHQQCCEITTHLSTGLSVKAKAKGYNTNTAFASAADKLTKQLRRYNRQLKNHHKERRRPVTFSGATSAVLAPSPEISDNDESVDLQPIIIAEMETKIPMLSVGEAVLQMEFEEEQMLVFRNLSHGRVNVVHKRDDGNIGWIDPTLDE